MKWFVIIGLINGLVLLFAGVFLQNIMVLCSGLTVLILTSFVSFIIVNEFGGGNDGSLS